MASRTTPPHGLTTPPHGLTTPPYGLTTPVHGADCKPERGISVTQSYLPIPKPGPLQDLKAPQEEIPDMAGWKRARVTIRVAETGTVRTEGRWQWEAQQGAMLQRAPMLT